MFYISYEMAKALLIKPDSPEPASESVRRPVPAPTKNHRPVPARMKSRKPARMPAVCCRAWIVVTRLATQWLW
jgi:hypothetical protein